MTVKDFVKGFYDKKIINTKVKPNAIEEYIDNSIKFRQYIPFEEKRRVIDIMTNESVYEEDGIKKVDSINQYINFVVTMIVTHTDLVFGDNPISDFDELSESKLLPMIVERFKESYDEFSTMLGMRIKDELENNNINVVFNRFLNNLLMPLDTLSVSLKNKIESADFQKLIGDIKDIDMERLKELINI